MKRYIPGIVLLLVALGLVAASVQQIGVVPNFATTNTAPTLTNIVQSLGGGGGGGAQVWTTNTLGPGQFTIAGQSNSFNFIVAPNISSNGFDPPDFEITGGMPNAGAIGTYRGDVIQLETHDARDSIASMGVDYDQPWIYLYMSGTPSHDVTVLDGMQNFSDKPYYFNTGTNVVAAGSVHTAIANAGTNIFTIYGNGNIDGAVSFYNVHVVTNGTDTAFLHFTNGLLMKVTVP